MEANWFYQEICLQLSTSYIHFRAVGPRGQGGTLVCLLLFFAQSLTKLVRICPFFVSSIGDDNLLVLLLFTKREASWLHVLQNRNKLLSLSVLCMHFYPLCTSIPVSIVSNMDDLLILFAINCELQHTSLRCIWRRESHASFTNPLLPTNSALCRIIRADSFSEMK